MSEWLSVMLYMCDMTRVWVIIGDVVPEWLSVMLYLCDMTHVQVIIGDVVPVWHDTCLSDYRWCCTCVTWHVSEWLSVMLYLCDMTRVWVIVSDVVPAWHDTCPSDCRWCCTCVTWHVSEWLSVMLYLCLFYLQVQPNSSNLVYNTLLELYLHDLTHKDEISVSPCFYSSCILNTDLYWFTVTYKTGLHPSVY